MKKQLLKSLMVSVVVAAIAVLITIDNISAKTVAFLVLLAMIRLARRKMGLPARMPTKDEAKIGYNLEQSMPVNSHHNHLHQVDRNQTKGPGD